MLALVVEIKYKTTMWEFRWDLKNILQIVSYNQFVQRRIFFKLKHPELTLLASSNEIPPLFPITFPRQMYKGKSKKLCRHLTHFARRNFDMVETVETWSKWV